MCEIFEFLVSEEYNEKRLDQVITANIMDITRSYVQKLIKNNNVFVNNNIINDKNYRVLINQIIKVNIPAPDKLSLIPENIPIDIVYEDNDLLVVNKPKGMVVHPAPGNYSGTLVNALMYYCKDTLSSINGTIRPGIVHRIDKDTSGLLIVAKNDFSHRALAAQIKEHSFSREYEAVIYGNLKSDTGTVNAPIGRNKIDRKKMSVTNDNSKPALTHYTVIKRYNGFTHVRLKLETGRTHQIRVHMAYIGHPVAGDPVYGPRNIIKSLNGQCLHAKLIGFLHPRYSEFMSFESDLPEYFKCFLRSLN